MTAAKLRSSIRAATARTLAALLARKQPPRRKR